MTGRELVAMPILDAMKAKWEEGLKEYGRAPDEPFKGEKGVFELFGELVDGLNYCNQAEEEGFDVASIREHVLAAAVLTRLAVREQVER